MLVSDSLFDVILFGALLLASVLDFFCPALQGACTLFVAGAAIYVAAQELCDALAHRNWWTQESLATSLALSMGGFVYYWWRNQSDLALLVLSIGLMMASLMVTISFIAALGTAFKDKSAQPLVGLVLTTGGALALGLLAGLLTILTLNAALAITLAAASGLALWKVREKVKPPARNAMAQSVLPAGVAERPEASPTASPLVNGGAGAEARPTQSLPHPGGRWMIVPQRGTLLDRFLPVLVLGALLFAVLKGAGTALVFPSSSASAFSNSLKK